MDAVVMSSWNYAKRACWSVVLVVGLLGGKASGADATSDLFPDPILARGDGVLVRQHDLDEAFIAYKANMVARRRPIPESQRSLRETQLLDRLIVTQILINRVTEADRVKARQIASDYLADTKKMATSEDVFASQLRAMGLTLAQFNVRVMEQALADAVLDRELKSTIEINDAQVKDFYETGRDILVASAEAELERVNTGTRKISAEEAEQIRARIEKIRTTNLNHLQEPERVQVSHLFFSTLERGSETAIPEQEQRAKRASLEKLLARAKAGEDFLKLVELYSEDRRAKTTNKVYTITRDSNLVPAFKSAAFTLRPGQISDIVTSALGYHVIKCHDRFPSSKIPFAEAGEEIRKFLAEQELQKRLPKYFADLKRTAQVEIVSQRFNVNFEELGLLPPVNGE
jgi:parvulin-like peptidyl-prolyl isomerase